MNPKTVPNKVPPMTCPSVCCRSNILLLPTTPDIKIRIHSQLMGLKSKSVE